MTAFRDARSSEDFRALHEVARGPLLLWITSLGAVHRRGLDPLELLQDTFVNVYRYAASFRDEGPRSFRVWSRTIAGNLVRRARWNRERALQDLPEGCQEPADLRRGPTEELQRTEEGRELARAWLLLLSRYAAAYERLSARDRLALDLVEIQGLRYSEACARLRVGLSNLKMILFRARRRIRIALARELEVGAPRALRRAG